MGTSLYICLGVLQLENKDEIRREELCNVVVTLMIEKRQSQKIDKQFIDYQKVNYRK